MKPTNALAIPLLILLFTFIFFMCYVEDKRRKLPQRDRFGFTQDEQLWLSQFKVSKWWNIVNLGLVVCLLVYLERGTTRAADIAAYALTWYLLSSWESQKVIRKLLNYINKLEQKK